MPSPARPWTRRTFAALAHRNYRLMWTGTLVSHTGDWMDQVALNWLVISTSGSPFDLALVNLCRGLPILLFTLVGGAMADRFERRRLMMVTQSCAMALAFVLAAMVLAGTVSLLLVAAVATARGIVVSFNLPARHSLVPALVPREDLANAVALNAMTQNVTKIVGPALAGLIIATLGTGACFLINGISFLAVLWTLHAVRVPETAPAAEEVLPLRRSIAEGLRYVRDDRAVLLLVLVALVPTFFGQPYMTLLAVFAHSVHEVGPEGLGLLTSSAAAGAVAGGLLLAGRSRGAASGRAMLAYLGGFGAMLCAFALNPVWLLAPVLLVGVGMMQIAYSATNNTILQMRVPDRMRGRVMSILLLNRGLVQLGAAFAGTLSGFVGAPTAVAMTGGTIVVFAAVVWWRSARLRTIGDG